MKPPPMDIRSISYPLHLQRTHCSILEAKWSFTLPLRPQDGPAKLGESRGVIGYPLPRYLSTEPKVTFGQVNSIAGRQALSTEAVASQGLRSTVQVICIVE
jgi:hypothetical protein